jgi:hypothetical protein
MTQRGANFKQVEVNIVGSSTFGRYPKISNEKTYNMFQSDTFMVSYAGYYPAMRSSTFYNNGVQGRGCFTSTKFNSIVTVIDANVYLTRINFNQQNISFDFMQATLIGQLLTSTGVVYIAENNNPQIAISDGTAIYIYDPSQTIHFQQAIINFVPGYITFHDARFICAAKQDDTSGTIVTNNWRLSSTTSSGALAGGLTWPSTAAFVGSLQTKPDNIQAVVRFPSQGNMIWVMGSIVSESWFDTGAQLFPYQRNNQYNIDYGCLSPATVAYMDEIVVWLAQNEKSGAVIMYSSGGAPQKITTDGIDYLLSTLQTPSDSQGYLYRQDGHLFYHINFYSDNLSLFYDFNTQKFYHACDQNQNYFIASQVAFYNNQYYFTSTNSGNLYAFDTVYTTFTDIDSNGNMIINEIPRFRVCKNIRQASQDYFIANDVGFTIESGETSPQQEIIGDIRLITQNGSLLISQGNIIQLVTQDGNYLSTQLGQNLITEQKDNTDFSYLITNQKAYVYIQPRVDLSISIDGGATFSSDMPYVLPPLGYRKNRMMWWQLGIANDMVCQFKFWGLGRFVITNGVMNTRL